MRTTCPSTSTSSDGVAIARPYRRTVGQICDSSAAARSVANTNTILQVVPLIVTASAAIFLREPVGWRRWTAIAVGFAGVLIVIRPGLAGFNSFSLFALASAGFIALRDMATRVMPVRVPTLLIALVTAIVVGLSGPV